MSEVNKSNGFSSPLSSGVEVGKIIGGREREKRAIEGEKTWEGAGDNLTREERRGPGSACGSTESSEMQRF